MAQTKKTKKGLGRGLDALLGPGVLDSMDSVQAQAPQTLRIAQLQTGTYQPRTTMDEGALYELAQSIKTQGLMQPILVRALKPAVLAQSDSLDAGTQFNSVTPGYEIIAGERRFRAAQIAGLDSVPVLVREVSDENAAIMALIENIQREDLNPLEEAQGIQRLIGEFGLTHEQVAQALGRSRSAASNLLRLLQLAAPVQVMLRAGDLDMGHARALLSLDKAQQITTANQIITRKLSVREAEKLVRKTTSPDDTKKTPTNTTKKPRDLLQVEETLSDLLASTVEVRIKKRVRQGNKTHQQGELAIAFASLDALNGLLDRLCQGLAKPNE